MHGLASLNSLELPFCDSVQESGSNYRAREGGEGDRTRHLRVEDGDSLAGEVLLAGRQGNGEEQLAGLTMWCLILPP